MGVRVTDATHVALFDSTGGVPYALPVFESAEHALDFIRWMNITFPHRELDDWNPLALVDHWQTWWRERVEQTTGVLRE